MADLPRVLRSDHGTVAVELLTKPGIFQLVALGPDGHAFLRAVRLPRHPGGCVDEGFLRKHEQAIPSLRELK